MKTAKTKNGAYHTDLNRLAAMLACDRIQETDPDSFTPDELAAADDRKRCARTWQNVASNNVNAGIWERVFKRVNGRIRRSYKMKAKQ